MNPPGLYVHTPFCKTKCPYCGFFSVAPPAGVPGWLDALDREARLYEGRFDGGVPFDTLYLGGGTPSVLDLGVLESLLESLRIIFHFAPDTEVTLEANPGDMTDAFAAGSRAIGINRINLGVQAFDDGALALLGRRHTAGEAHEALEALRAAGFENVGLDLIYGLPGQSLDHWGETLGRALRYRPEHLSCYELTIEGGTPFERIAEAGRLRLPGEEESRAFFLATAERLEAEGYVHYEISNFALGNRFRSRHNCKYWNHTPYLGLGPSAHSFPGGKRWWNVSSVDTYVEALEEGRAPVAGEEVLTEAQLALEAVTLGLRTRDGVPVSAIPASPGLADRIASLRESGHIRVEGERIVPTREGFLVADRLPLVL